MTDDEKDAVLSRLLTQQVVTNRLLAAQLRLELTQAELILLLESTGATLGEIAQVLGTTAATVSNVFVRARKRAKGKRGPVRTRQSEQVGQ